MTPRELLDAYAAQDPVDGDYGKFRREEAAQELFSAVRDILDAHRVVRRGGRCRACTFHWPCATARIITKHLEEAS